MKRTSICGLGTLLCCLVLTACGDDTKTSKVTPRKVDPNAQPVPAPDASFDGGRAKMGSSAQAPPGMTSDAKKKKSN